MKPILALVGVASLVAALVWARSTRRLHVVWKRVEVERGRDADVTVRFLRDWLDDWRSVAGNIERLIAKLRPPGS